MRKRINILYLITSFDIGGAQRAIARTVKRLDKAKYNIIVSSLKEGDGRIISELQTTNARIVNLGMQFKYDIRVLYKLYSLLRKNRIDLIYAYLFHAIFLSRIIGKLAEIPIILSSERNITDAENYLRLQLNRFTCRYSDKISTVSQAVYRDYKTVVGIPESKLITIYNGIEVDRFIYSPFKEKTNNSYVIGCVGRLHPKNGYKYLIEAAHILRDRNLLYRFIGDGEERTNLEQQVKDRSLQNRVEFCGYRSDIPDQLAMLNIYVQPSLYEGMPNSVLEAMASGLPIIATNVGGNSEVIIDNQTGFLVPSQNPNAIADKIAYIIEHPDVAMQIGQNARAYVKKNFSVENMVRKTNELFETVIQAKLGLTYDESLQCWR